MLVVMVLVMAMPVRMLKQLMTVFVFMPLAHVQPDAQRHQGGCNPERQIG